jgi:beta-carotene 3-hydroxylase
MAVARLVAAAAAAPFPVAASRLRAPRLAASVSRAAPRLVVLAPLPVRPRARVGADDEAVVAGEAADGGEGEATRRAVSERAARKQSERRTYLVAAVMSSLGITSMAAAAVYYRFAWQMEVRTHAPLATAAIPRHSLMPFLPAGWVDQGGEIPVTEMVGTFALSVGAAVSDDCFRRATRHARRASAP